MSKRAKDWADRWVAKGIDGAAPSTGAVLRELAKLADEREASKAGMPEEHKLRRHGTVEHCWIRLENLATRAGCSKATTKRALDVLNDAGLVLRTPRRDRHGWITCIDLFLNVSDEPSEQFATRLDLVWRRVEKAGEDEPQPKAQNELQDSPSLKLILDGPKAQNELHSIRLTPERDSEGGDAPPKSSLKKGKRSPPKSARGQLSKGAAPNPEIAFAERNVTVNQYGELEIGQELRQRLRRVASDELIDLALPRALANAQAPRTPIRLLEQINRALSYARQDVAKAANRGRFGVRGQAPPTAAAEEAARQMAETIAEMRREEDEARQKRLQAEAVQLEARRVARMTESGGQWHGPPPISKPPADGLTVDEQLGRLNEAVEDGRFGGHSPRQTERRTDNVA